MSDVNPSAAGDNANGMALTDSIYNRLLKERIIWLGSEVRDDNANAICAQMLLLAAEDPEADIYLYINSRHGHLRHHAVCTARRGNCGHRYGCLHGPVPALFWC